MVANERCTAAMRHNAVAYLALIAEREVAARRVGLLLDHSASLGSGLLAGDGRRVVPAGLRVVEAEVAAPTYQRLLLRTVVSAV